MAVGQLVAVPSVNVEVAASRDARVVVGAGGVPVVVAERSGTPGQTFDACESDGSTASPPEAATTTDRFGESGMAASIPYGRS